LYGIKVYGVGAVSSDVTFIPGLVAIVLPVLKLKKVNTQITQYLSSLLSSLKETGISCVYPFELLNQGTDFYKTS
jgi:hypothetical protein